MALLRLRSTNYYFTLNEHQRKCYNAGLPIRYSGKGLDDLEFVSYAVGDIKPKMVTATKQETSLSAFAAGMDISKGHSGIMAFHSSPTDEAAFQAASYIFETALARSFSCACVSATYLLQHSNIEAKDVYLIHGITDPSSANALWAVRDFLRDRDGSLRMLVMTSGKGLALDTIIHEQLRMRVDFLFCLQDKTEMIATDYRMPRTKVRDA